MLSMVQALYCPLGTVTRFPDSHLWSLDHCDQLDFPSDHWARSVDPTRLDISPLLSAFYRSTLNESVEVSVQDNERDDKGWFARCFFPIKALFA